MLFWKSNAKSGVCVCVSRDLHIEICFSSSLNGITDSLETYAQTSIPPGGSPTDPNPSGPGGGIPLDQLKQMLSSQLEYYFSRYVIQLINVNCFCLRSNGHISDKLLQI
jgi:hypothetical protein